MSDAEEWRDITGYEGQYAISSHGRVRSLPRHIFTPSRNRYRYTKGLFLAIHNDPHGYPSVRLCKDGKLKNFCIHVLVATEFVGHKPYPEAQVRHLDGNKMNPRPDN